ncbi:helix-turn-helix domain-containing protein [Nocardia sp. NPDC058058]|uniref:helix-turn-helix domain-containing protein n=1 Tax=Nocardia sp. NPDC058058 TaxID=3346317 RepID=UPI0036DEDDDD
MIGSTGCATVALRICDTGVRMAEMTLLSGSTAEVDADDRPAFWRHHVHNNHGGTRIRYANSRGFSGATVVQRLSNYRLGDFQAVDFTSQEVSYERDSAHIGNDGDRSGRLLIPRRGLLGLAQGDSTVQLRPGQLGVVDWGQPMTLAHSDQVRAWILTVPAGVIRAVRGNRPHLALEACDPLLGSVVALAEQLHRHRATLTAQQFLTTSTHLVGLLAAALDERRAPESTRLAAISRDAQRHIRAYSDDPRLTVDTLAENLGITRRQLERAMRLAQTTPHAFLLKARVQRAAERLTDPLWAGRTVTDIAFECGFSAMSVFNKAFRDHYKLTPGEMRRGATRR